MAHWTCARCMLCSFLFDRCVAFCHYWFNTILFPAWSVFIVFCQCVVLQFRPTIKILHHRSKHWQKTKCLFYSIVGTHGVAATVCFLSWCKILLETVGILSLCKYCWSIGLQIVFLGTHGLQCLFSFMMENSIELQIVFLCTHGVQCLFLLGQLEFSACANIINHFNASVSVHLSNK